MAAIGLCVENSDRPANTNYAAIRDCGSRGLMLPNMGMLDAMFSNSGNVPGLLTDGSYYWSSEVGYTAGAGTGYVVAPGNIYAQTAVSNVSAIRCVRHD